jgi:hypothetical protein
MTESASSSYASSHKTPVLAGVVKGLLASITIPSQAQQAHGLAALFAAALHIFQA